jgi:hypothetical protein
MLRGVHEEMRGFFASQAMTAGVLCVEELSSTT